MALLPYVCVKPSVKTRTENKLENPECESERDNKVNN